MATTFVNDPEIEELKAAVEEELSKPDKKKQGRPKNDPSEDEADKYFVRGKTKPSRRGYKLPILRPYRVGVVNCPDALLRFAPMPETIQASSEVDAINKFINAEDESRKDMRKRHIRFEFGAKPLFNQEEVIRDNLESRRKENLRISNGYA